MLSKIKQTKAVLNRSILFTASILTAVLVICALWQVFSRYVLGAPSIITEELSRFLLIWVAMFGAAYAFGSNDQLAIIFLKSKMTGSRKSVIEYFIDFIVIIFASLILINGGVSLVSNTLSQISPILEISMGYVYSIIPITGVLIIVYQIINVLERRGGNDTDEESVYNSVPPEIKGK